MLLNRTLGSVVAGDNGSLTWHRFLLSCWVLIPSNECVSSNSDGLAGPVPIPRRTGVRSTRPVVHRIKVIRAASFHQDRVTQSKRFHRILFARIRSPISPLSRSSSIAPATNCERTALAWLLLRLLTDLHQIITRLGVVLVWLGVAPCRV